MKTSLTNNANRDWRIANNFRFSNLTEEQFLNACKQYLYSQKHDDNFRMLTSTEQEDYLLKNNVLGFRFLGDKELIEILKNNENIKLVEIFSIISAVSSRSSCASNINLNLSILLNGKDNILLVGVEMMLNQIPTLCSKDKNITLWTINNTIKEILDFDFENNANINVELIDIYEEANNKQTKYDSIICVPAFGLKRHFKRGMCYGNDSSTIAAELLFKHNLSENGTLMVTMPNKVNFSQMETHFRQAFAGNLTEVIELPTGTFSMTSIKTYLYKFNKKYSDNIYISDSIDMLGEKINLQDITNPDTTWDFEKPFKNEDADISFVLNNNHKKLSEVSNILRGKPLSKLAKETNEKEDFTYVDMRVLKDDDIDFLETKKYILDKNLSSDFLQDGDLLIPNKGSSAKVVMYKHSDKNCIASANLIVIRADKNIINPEYLLMYLRSSVGQKLIKGLQRGAALPFISHEDLKGLAVIVPALVKQNELIDNFQGKMKKYKKQLEDAMQCISNLETEINDIICGRKEKFN